VRLRGDIPHCPYWQAVGNKAFAGWDNVDVAAVDQAQIQAMRLRQIVGLTRGDARLAPAAALIADHHRRVYDAASSVAGASVLVDSSKHPALAYILRHEPGIDLRVVHVVRDSRARRFRNTRPKAVTRATTEQVDASTFLPLLP
jgi:hypothetical protein